MTDRSPLSRLPIAPAAAGPLLEQTLDVETPEQVVLTYTIAGVGSRAAAAMVDTLVVLAAWLTLGALLSWAAREFGALDSSLRTPWLTAVGIAGQFILQWGYFVLFEAIADGQTPGKKRFGLRVVQDGGYSVTFGASAVRNLVRIVDMQPGIFYFVGITSVVLTRTGKRLGDIAAGTLVVQERSVRVRESPPAARPSPAAAGDGEAPAPLRPRLPDDVFLLLERFAARAGELDPDRRRDFAQRLARRVAPLLPDERVRVEDDLRRVLAAERGVRAARMAGGSADGSRREERAVVAGGLARWRDFAAQLEQAQRRGLAALDEAALTRFVADYREAAADLARLRTAARGRTPEELYYLSRLVAAGHNLLYRRRELPLHEIARFVATTAPAEIRRSWRPIALAAVLLFGPMLVAFAEVRAAPARWEWLVGEGIRARVEEGLERPAEGRAYLPPGEAAARGPVLASAITTNNVQVAYVAFGTGIALGVPTVLALVSNGLSIGAVLGYYDANGLVRQILGFVAAHGVLELFAICVAGGAGFLLAAGLLVPGARTRREALVENGRRAIVLVGGATALLLVAGLIEGTISPNEWPDAAKYAVSAATAVGLGLWVGLGTRDSGLGSEWRS